MPNNTVEVVVGAVVVMGVVVLDIAELSSSSSRIAISLYMSGSG